MANDVTPDQLKEWIDAGEVRLIDVRGSNEFDARRIEGARLMPLPKFSPDAVPEGGKVVVLCRSGMRGAIAADRLAGTGRDEVYNLAGGIVAYQKAGHPVTVDRKIDMPIMRQVQLVAGGVVLATVVLGVTVSPWFLIVSGWFGAGLFFSGATGICPMAWMLEQMPWNRGGKAGASCCADGECSSGGCC